MNRLNDFSYYCRHIVNTCQGFLPGCDMSDIYLTNHLADEYQRFTELPRAIRYQQNVEKEVLE